MVEANKQVDLGSLFFEDINITYDQGLSEAVPLIIFKG
jgi:hypothetical protein